MLPKGLIQKVDISCLIMLREHKQEAVLTVCQPDLALYRGPSDDIYDEQGKRIERSIYSRPWIGNPSQSIPVRIELKGKWEIDETPEQKQSPQILKNSIRVYLYRCSKPGSKTS